MRSFAKINPSRKFPVYSIHSKFFAYMFLSSVINLFEKILECQYLEGKQNNVDATVHNQFHIF